MAELIGRPGFALPKPAKVLSIRRAVALELIATLALGASLVVAATAVSLDNKSFARSDFAERPSVPMPAARQ